MYFYLNNIEVYDITDIKEFWKKISILNGKIFIVIIIIFRYIIIIIILKYPIFPNY